MSPDYRSLEVVAAREGTASKRQRVHSPAACERIYPPHGGCDRPDSDPREVVPFQRLSAPVNDPPPTPGANGPLPKKPHRAARGVVAALPNRPKKPKFSPWARGIKRSSRSLPPVIPYRLTF